MTLLAWLYALVSAVLAVYGINNLLLTLVCLFRKHPQQNKASAPISWPRVTVQLPVFNEVHVVRRLVDAVAALDYPAELLQIQVLDDSTDGTTAVARRAVARHAAQGLDVELVHRTHRSGYKAGALQAAMPRARGEFIAVFDADFVPPASFLRELLPHFVAQQVGCVQARWDHLNRHASLVTQVQALGIDRHFAVEQQARGTMGLFLNFNGSAGIWRRSCIEEAGGWQPDTLAEDLDLSYRAQLKGWKILYDPTVRVPGELPPQFDAIRRQQARWAQGSTQVAVKIIPALMGSSQPVRIKLEGLLHLTGYWVQPLLIVALALGVPLLWAGGSVVGLLPQCALATIAPSLLHVLAQSEDHRQRLDRIRFIPLLLLFGLGLAWSNTMAVGRGLLERRWEFQRTPKFGLNEGHSEWTKSGYRLAMTGEVWGEVLLSLVSLPLALLALVMGRGSAAWWLGFYGMGFGGVAALSLFQSWQCGRPARGVAKHTSTDYVRTAMSHREAEAAVAVGPRSARR